MRGMSAARQWRNLGSDRESTNLGLTSSPSNAVTIYNFGRAVAASAGRVHATWEEDGPGEEGGSQVYYGRSTDAGATWAGPIRLSTGGTASGSTIAASGDLVIVAFNQVDQIDGVPKYTFHVRSCTSAA